FGGDIEGQAALLLEAIEAVAADLLAFEPAVGGEPRHRGAHDTRVDVERLEEFQQRAEPHRAATRHDRVTEHGDDDRAGARGLALELVDDTGKRMRHPLRHTAICAGTTTPPLLLLPAGGARWKVLSGSGRDRPSRASRSGRTASTALPAAPDDRR